MTEGDQYSGEYEGTVQPAETDPGVAGFIPAERLAQLEDELIEHAGCVHKYQEALDGARNAMRVVLDEIHKLRTDHGL